MLGFLPDSMRVSPPRVVGMWVAVVGCALLVGCGSSGGKGAEEPGGAGPEDEKIAPGSEAGSADAAPGPNEGESGAGEAPDVGGGEIVSEPGDDEEDDKTAAEESAGAQATASATSTGVEIKGDRNKMSEFLVAPAKKAVEERNYSLAIALYQALVVARGPGSPEARELATTWRRASQFGEAMAVVDGIIDSTEDPKLLEWARAEKRSLATAENPFASKFEVDRANAYARRAFQAGRKEFKAGRYGDALVYFEMGYALDPDLPGFLREMGATYDKLGAADKKIDFYLAYLRRRPLGKNADEIRKELGDKKKDVLGTLSVKSALPCEEVWVVGQPAPKLPIQKLRLAPGSYKWLCTNFTYGINVFDYAKVEPGKTTELEFHWAIVVNGLQSPRGRIRLEHAWEAGVMMDLGIHQKELGVLIPRDGRALKVELRSLDGSRFEEKFVRFRAGQKEVIKWGN